MRYIENWLAGLGGLIAAAYVILVEVLPHSGLVSCQTPSIHPGFPWGVVIICSIMVAPKTLGRATAGKVWEVVARRLPARLSGGTRRPRGADHERG